MLFMKGNKLFPQCGFSNTAVMIMKSITEDFETFDVLSDNEIREGIKTYSNWPTIPQCYIDGEFIGGCDLMIEMYQSGELCVERRLDLTHRGMLSLTFSHALESNPTIAGRRWSRRVSHRRFMSSWLRQVSEPLRVDALASCLPVSCVRIIC